MRSVDPKHHSLRDDPQRIVNLPAPERSPTAFRSGLERLSEVEAGTSRSFLVSPWQIVPTDQADAGCGSAMDLLPECLGIKVVLPAAGDVRARKIISRSRRVMTGKYPSFKAGRMLHWESRTESCAFKLLDVCPAVKTFAEQPFTILYLQDGEWLAHIPDIAVETHLGERWILEVKSACDRALEGAMRRADTLAPRLRLFGWRYAVIHQDDINAGTALKNARFLLKHGRGAPSALAHQEFCTLLKEKAMVSRRDLVGLRIDGAHAIDTGAQLAIRGLISLNWNHANSVEIQFRQLTDDNSSESLTWLLRALGATNRL